MRFEMIKGVFRLVSGKNKERGPGYAVACGCPNCQWSREVGREASRKVDEVMSELEDTIVKIEEEIEGK